ncbi:prolipoprotein diacylglyceryl transferase [Sporomusa acidovorans]|uniref:prolipoprotein diacylglyceryl transferase n=1 Tax=Sporomusa acidovorans TaxID=112900 RepID=UPI0008837A71|nr:prolipoprotein diacylglyceryl transferase [Sporomusa acidovorans]OZC19066.1 prolipoprotein diacylglyceryl transferase [Sporomusa acidovorans DSM 3132]SDD66207.1 phosphatidylglycerol:prolipoprotein diacylglycerol transferase [Sporomusa acidovorans]
MQPILFTIGEFEVRAWGLMVALGVLAGLWLATRLGKNSEFTEDILLEYVVYGLFAGILGARLWEVVFSWEQYAANPLHALMFWEGGLSIQGAVIANVLLALRYFPRKGLSFRRFVDIGAPALILGQAIGRIGCLFNGDAYGKPTDAWYGVVYQPGTPAYSAWGNVPLVPAELFEAGLDMVILWVLLYLFPRKQFDGQVALAYFVLYSLARFGLEFLRTDSLLIGGLKAAQLTALLTALAASLLWAWYATRTKVVIREVGYLRNLDRKKAKGV